MKGKITKALIIESFYIYGVKVNILFSFKFTVGIFPHFGYI